MSYYLVVISAALGLVLFSCDGGGSEDRLLELEIRNQELVQGGLSLEVNQGDSVTITISADEPLSFHLHGYNIKRDVRIGEPAILIFIAENTCGCPITIHTLSENHDEEDGGEHQPDHGNGEETIDTEIGRLGVYPRRWPLGPVALE